MNIENGLFEFSHNRRIGLGGRGAHLLCLNPEPGGGHFCAVEFPGPSKQRPIAFAADLGQDAPHFVLYPAGDQVFSLLEAGEKAVTVALPINGYHANAFLSLPRKS
jgi:hypothetical protein